MKKNSKEISSLSGGFLGSRRLSGKKNMDISSFATQVLGMLKIL